MASIGVAWKHVRRLGAGAGIAVAGVMISAGAQAQGADDVAAFFKGRTVSAIVGFQGGSSSDAYMRTFARHVSRHLPGNPTVVIQHMPGAGSLVSTLHLANVAAKDGTVFALYNPGILIEPLINPQTAKFDPRTFGWIGSLADEQTMCGFWAKDIATLEDLRKREVVLGSTGGTAGSAVEARLIARMLGLKFRIVEGYRGLAEVRLAAERGEVDGHCSLYMSILKSEQEDAYKAGRIKIPIQLGLMDHPELPNVPNVYKLVDDDNRQLLRLLSTQWAVARPLSLPPGVPAARIAAWRAAFEATVKDPEFAAEAAKSKLYVNPLSGADIEPIIAAMMQTPEHVLVRARAIIKGQ